MKSDSASSSDFFSVRKSRGREGGGDVKISTSPQVGGALTDAEPVWRDNVALLPLSEIDG